MLQGEFMREEATTGDDVSKVMKPILKVGESAKDGAGPQPQEKNVRFADTSPALSAEENKVIKDFSNTFALNENRMTQIFQDSKTPEGIKDIDKAYLVNEGGKNSNFKKSSFFKGLLPENDKKVENGPASLAVNGNNFEEDQLKKKGGLTSEGQEKGGGEEKKGDNKKLMLAMGFLFIACIFLATGGAALPIIGGFLASSQGLLIAGAVGAGLVGAGSFIKDQISQGNNNPGGMKMVEGVGAQGQGQTQENAPAPAPEKAQGQAPAQEKAQGQGQTPEKAQGQAPAQEKAQGQGQTPEKAQAPAPDLMELMKQDLQAQRAQLVNEKDILRGFKQELDSNPKLNNTATSQDYKTESQKLSPDDLAKLSALPKDIKDKSSQVDKIEPDGIAKKSSQALSKDIGDSKSENRTTEALNLEDNKLESKILNRPERPSGTWANRVVQSKSRGGSNEI